MNNKTKYIDLGLSISLLLLLGVALMPILHIFWVGSPYVYTVGALGALVCRILDRYKGKVIILKRLHRLALVSALCYVMSAFFMIYGIYFDPTITTDWLAFLTAGAALQVYVSFRLQYEEKKEARKELK